MKKDGNPQKFRVQFDFAPQALARVDRLVEITEATTRADVVRSALRLYEWLVNRALEGKSMSLNGVQETEGPIDLQLITGAVAGSHVDRDATPKTKS